MYAVFTEVNADDSNMEVGRQVVPQFAVPKAKEAGARGGYWLAPRDGRAIAVVVFDTEEQARQAASMFEIGKPPMPEAPPNVTVKTVEVREVIASL
jgi:hypothetical protein